jgi:Holliday junction resolvase RusA-like endonuclease
MRKKDGGYTARVFSSSTAEGWKSEIALALRKWAGTKHAGPVLVAMTFEFARPKSHFRANGLLKLTAPRWHAGKPDADNLEKAVLDACTQIGIWKDDGQVVTLIAHKVWTSGNRGAGMTLTIADAYEPGAEEAF